MTQVTLTIQGSTGEVAAVIRHMAGWGTPQPKVVQTDERQPLPATGPSNGWTAVAARRAAGQANGNTALILNSLIAAADHRMPEAAALAMLNTTRRGLGGVKRSLERIRQKTMPTAPDIMLPDGNGNLRLNPGFAAAIADATASH